MDALAVEDTGTNQDPNEQDPPVDSEQKKSHNLVQIHLRRPVHDYSWSTWLKVKVNVNSQERTAARDKQMHNAYYSGLPLLHVALGYLRWLTKHVVATDTISQNMFILEDPSARLEKSKAL